MVGWRSGALPSRLIVIGVLTIEKCHRTKAGKLTERGGGSTVGQFDGFKWLNWSDLLASLGLAWLNMAKLDWTWLNLAKLPILGGKKLAQHLIYFTKIAKVGKTWLNLAVFVWFYRFLSVFVCLFLSVLGSSIFDAMSIAVPSTFSSCNEAIGVYLQQLIWMVFFKLWL